MHERTKELRGEMLAMPLFGSASKDLKRVNGNCPDRPMASGRLQNLTAAYRTARSIFYVFGKGTVVGRAPEVLSGRFSFVR